MLEILLLVACAALAAGHPQCLDGKPPFEPSQSLTFCTDYAQLGCCDYRQDQSIKARYDTLVRDLSHRDSACRKHFKTLLCQACSPYAAHLYSYEERGYLSPIPGMCTNYCHTVYDSCTAHNLWIFSSDSQFRSKIQNRNDFCSYATTVDPDYCYPELLNNSALIGQFTPELNSDTPGCMCLQKMIENIGLVTVIETNPADPDLIYIGHQKGVFHVYDLQGKLLTTGQPFLNLSSNVTITRSRGDERGLLGMAFDPQYQSNRRFVVYYQFTVGRQQSVRISQFVARNRLSARQRSERVILEVAQPFSNHNGGQVLFGEDGKLFIFTGDGGSSGDPMNSAQNMTSFLGKVLRVDIDRNRRSGYIVPLDNPFVSRSNALPEIWAYGMRNPWRCSMDPGNVITGEGRGRIFCADVGQNAFEEIDLIKKGGNYGWASREGFQCYSRRGRATCGTIGPEELPIHAYPHSMGKSVTGGYVYRGCDYPDHSGKYFFGDWTNGKLFTLTETPLNTWTSSEIKMCSSQTCTGNWVSSYPNGITTFGQIQSGDILFSAATGGAFNDGAHVYKFVMHPERRSDPSACLHQGNQSTSSRSKTFSLQDAVSRRLSSTSTNSRINARIPSDLIRPPRLLNRPILQTTTTSNNVVRKQTTLDIYSYLGIENFRPQLMTAKPLANPKVGLTTKDWSYQQNTPQPVTTFKYRRSTTWKTPIIIKSSQEGSVSDEKTTPRVDFSLRAPVTPPYNSYRYSPSRVSRYRISRVRIGKTTTTKPTTRRNTIRLRRLTTPRAPYRYRYTPRVTVRYTPRPTVRYTLRPTVYYTPRPITSALNSFLKHIHVSTTPTPSRRSITARFDFDERTTLKPVKITPSNGRSHTKSLGFNARYELPDYLKEDLISLYNNIYPHQTDSTLNLPSQPETQIYYPPPDTTDERQTTNTRYNPQTEYMNSLTLIQQPYNFLLTNNRHSTRSEVGWAPGGFGTSNIEPDPLIPSINSELLQPIDQSYYQSRNIDSLSLVTANALPDYLQAPSSGDIRPSYICDNWLLSRTELCVN